jgi:hypothetical protein
MHIHIHIYKHTYTCVPSILGFDEGASHPKAKLAGICIYKYLHTYINLHIYTHTYLHLNIYIYICIYVYTYINIPSILGLEEGASEPKAKLAGIWTARPAAPPAHPCICMQVYMNKCMYLSIYIYIYLCM